jgi:transposase
MTKERAKQPRKSTAADRMKHRLHCVLLVLKGRSAREVAKLNGDSFGTVASWVRRYKKAGGAEGLKEEQRSGRPARLSPAQLKRLEAFVMKARAQSQLVTAQVLSDHIKKAFDVVLTARQCARILKRQRSHQE